MSARAIRLAALLAVSVSGGAIGQEQLHWARISDGAPAAQGRHAMFTNMASGRIMVLGGLMSIAGTGDNWEYEPVTGVWRLLGAAHPEQRFGSFAWDEARQVIVLLGHMPGGPVARTWEWDGTNWSFRSGAGPSRRSDAAMAWDAASGRTVLFGGAGNTHLSDTWEWDGSDWTLRSTTGPNIGSGHRMVFDPHLGRLVMPGYAANGYEMWAWDTAAGSWVLLASDGPPKRDGYGLAYDPVRERILMTGGTPHGWGSWFPTDDIWAWDSQTLQWQHLEVRLPALTRGHAMTHEPAGGDMLVFGGTSHAPLALEGDNFWALSPGGEWTTFHQRVPTARAGHAMGFDELTGRMIVMGPYYTYRAWFGHGHNPWVRESLSSLQHPVEYPMSIIFEHPGESILVFAENSHVTGSDNMLFRRASTGAWRALPMSGYAQPFAWRPVRMVALDDGRAVLFGGEGVVVGNQWTHGTWVWDGSSWTGPITTHPQPAKRERYAMAFDVHRRRVVMHGGWIYPSISGELWEWDPDGSGGWVQIPAAGPGPRFGHTMVYDRSRERIVLFGGERADGTLLNDLWEWDGETWFERVLSPAPPARSGHGMVYDTWRNLVVLFGGAAAGNRILGDLWELGSMCYANCDQSTAEPVLTVDDFTCFVNSFAGAQSLPPSQQIGHYANCDQSTTHPVLTVDDFVCFVNAFSAGCP